jgi:hypothetical protein
MNGVLTFHVWKVYPHGVGTFVHIFMPVIFLVIIMLGANLVIHTRTNTQGQWFFPRIDMLVLSNKKYETYLSWLPSVVTPKYKAMMSFQQFSFSLLK